MINPQSHQRWPVVRQILLVPSAAMAVIRSARVSRGKVNSSA